MKSPCPPTLILERLFVEGEETPEVRSHLEACATCQGRLREMKEQRTAFLSKYPFERVWDEISPRRRWARFWEKFLLPAPLRAGLAFAALAGLMVFVLWQRTGQDPMILTKGGVGLGFLVSHEGKVERGRDGISLRPGDEIQFLYSSSGERFLLLFGVEANRSLTVYYPQGGPSGSPIDLGQQKRLPQAIRWLPSSPYERFFALFSKEPVSIREVEEALRRAVAEGKSVEGMRRFPLRYPQVSLMVHRKN